MQIKCQFHESYKGVHGMLNLRFFKSCYMFFSPQKRQYTQQIKHLGHHHFSLYCTSIDFRMEVTQVFYVPTVPFLCCSQHLDPLQNNLVTRTPIHKQAHKQHHIFLTFEAISRGSYSTTTRYEQEKWRPLYYCSICPVLLCHTK